MSNISVIVPVFNTEKQIFRCVSSLVYQSFANYKIVFIDDGSTNGVSKMLDEYSNSDNRILIIHKTNRGVSSSRNCGIKIVDSDYISFVDSDDVVHPDYLTHLFNLIVEQYDLSVCKCKRPNYEYQDVFESIVVNFSDINDSMIDKFYNIFKTYSLHGCVCKLFKTSIVKNQNVMFENDIKYGEDFVFVFTYLKYCRNLIFSNRSLYDYYDDNDSSSSNNVYRNDRFVNGLRVNNFVFHDFLERKGIINNELKYIYYWSTFKDAYYSISEQSSLDDIKNVVYNFYCIEALNFVDLLHIKGYSRIKCLLMKKKFAALLFLFEKIRKV